MSYQPKVEKVEKYSDSQGTHTVCKGRLILIRIRDESDFKKNDIVFSDHSKFANSVKDWAYRPIIISETEKLEERDKIYNPLNAGNRGIIVEDKNGSLAYSANHNFESFHKVLALPKHFSEKHIQAIVDGKMEDGDEVLVKIDMGNYWGYPDLDQQNHITLFPAKKSLHDVAKEFAEKEAKSWASYEYDLVYHAVKYGAEWAKKNNY